MQIFRGSGVAIVTPFTQDGVDFSAFEKLIEFQIENGTDALIVCGTTGEPPTMTGAEKTAVIDFAIKQANGRIPVVASTGGNNTAAVIEASQAAQKAGADALLVVTPYYNKATQAGLIAHYNAVADAVDIPIIVYNVPGRTGLNMLPATLAQIGQHPNIAAMKEASGNIVQVSEMIRLCGDSVDLYSGDDAMTVPLISMGGIGVISVAANIIPQDMHAMCMAALDGDFKTARQMQLKINPLADRLFCEVSPIPIKAALQELGMCSDLVRLPLTPMGQATRESLVAAMQTYGLL